MEYKNVNDYEVIYMIRENDEDAENLMYEKYRPLLYKYVNKFYFTSIGQGVSALCVQVTARTPIGVSLPRGRRAEYQGLSIRCTLQGVYIQEEQADYPGKSRSMPKFRPK